MATPRDDIAGLIERLQDRASSAKVEELTSLLDSGEDLRRKTIDVAEQWQALALHAKQERDEAYDRVIQMMLDAPSPDADGHYTMTKEDVVAIVRRLASGPEKEGK